jgi:hypothetical protein
MPYKSICSRDLFRDQIVILTGGGAVSGIARPMSCPRWPHQEFGR